MSLGGPLAECECVDACPFFDERMGVTPLMIKLIKAQYCTGSRASNEQCARHMVLQALGARRVPVDLYPAEYLRAQELIEGA